MINFENIKTLEESNNIFDLIHTNIFFKDNTINLINDWILFNTKNKRDDISRNIINKLEIIDHKIYESILQNKTLTIAYLNKLDISLVIQLFEQNMRSNWISEEYFNSFYYLSQVNYFPQDSKISKIGKYHFWYAIVNIAYYLVSMTFIFMNKGFIYLIFSFLMMSVYEFGKFQVPILQDLVFLQIMKNVMIYSHDYLFFLITQIFMFYEKTMTKNTMQLLFSLYSVGVCMMGNKIQEIIISNNYVYTIYFLTLAKFAIKMICKSQ